MSILDRRYQYYAWVLLVVVAAILLLWLFAEWTRALPASISIVAVVIFAIPVFRPPPGWMYVRILALAFVVSSGGALAISADWRLELSRSILNLIGLESTFSAQDWADPTNLRIVFGGAVVTFICVLWLGRDNTAMGIVAAPINEISDNPDFGNLVKGFVNRLRSDLDRQDEESNWAVEYFVPLEAEVEIHRTGARSKRISQLLYAIKKNKSDNCILVLGEPGSGKSVALRKLARELLEEVERTGRFPLYINLRDWETPQSWSENHPPEPGEVEQEFRTWLQTSLRLRLGGYGSDFLSRHFEDLISQGRCFFILDSFDEIPLLLNVDEKHVLIHRFSQGLSVFLSGQNRNRGVLSSRYFRKPTALFEAALVLEIRPLTNTKIDLLASRRLLRDGYIEKIFEDMPELFQAARNPFFAALIVGFLQDKNNLPTSRAVLFEHYFESRFAYVLEYLKNPGWSYEKLLDMLSVIADRLFSGSHGFEMPASDLPELMVGVNNLTMLEAFRHARLLRISIGLNPRISFTHRRFAEYLSARNLLKTGRELPLADIPSDSLWRDTLVLYCEIAPNESANAVARYAWEHFSESVVELEGVQDPRWLRIVHLLRFISEAFRSRRGCIEPFSPELCKLICALVERGDILQAKWALEASVVLDERGFAMALKEAFDRKDPWLAETALRAGAYTISGTDHTKKHICDHVDSKSFLELWRDRSEMLFAFKISQNLGWAGAYYKLSMLDSVVAPMGAAALFWSKQKSGRPDIFGSAIVATILISLLLRLWPMTWALLCEMKMLRYQLHNHRLTFLLISPLLIGWAKFSSEWPWVPMIMVCSSIPLALMATHAYGSRVIDSMKISSWRGALSAFKFVMGIILLMCVAVPFVALYLWLVKKTFSAPSILEKVAYGAIPVLPILLLGKPFVIWIAKIFVNGCKGVKAFLAARKVPQELTREWIQTKWSEMPSGVFRIAFMWLIKDRRSVTGNWSDPVPYLESSRAASTLARLDERWRGLN